MFRHASMGMLFLLLALAAWPQGGGTPTVQSTGEATVYAAPTRAVFQLRLRCEEETMAAAMDRAEAFEGALGAALKEREVSAKAVEVSPPAVGSRPGRAVLVTARVEFSLGSLGRSDDMPKTFAENFDRLQAVAEALDCQLWGPELHSGDPDTLARSAVAAATENAFPHADAAAGILKSTIYAVDWVEVIEVRHNLTAGMAASVPNLREVSCTAKVKATYSLAPAG